MNHSKIMSRITSVVIGIVLAYGLGQIFGKITSDISTMLLILTVVSFSYWLLDKVILKPQRVKEALAVEAKIRAANKNESPEQLDQKVYSAIEPVLLPPWWIEWTAGFFWVIIIVFAVRSFWLEPYRIPSNSMMPTLENGDFILVKKYEYALTLPVVNYQIAEFKKPQRGEVVVFDSPTENLVLIKRIIGLPGDLVEYRNKKLSINGEPIPLVELEQYLNTVPEHGPPVLEPQYREDINGVTHNILRHPYYALSDDLRIGKSGFVYPRPYFDNCTYKGSDFSCKVPDGHYFMMGDNRDNSLDSRYWGFVPESNIIGRAFFIWFNVGKLSRIGSFQ